MKVTEAKIVQVVALPHDWWYDTSNRCPAVALTEVKVAYEDGTTFEGRVVVPLNEDLTLRFPAEVDEDGDAIHPWSDNAHFLQHLSGHEAYE